MPFAATWMQLETSDQEKWERERPLNPTYTHHISLLSHSVISDSVDCMDCSPPGSSVHGILQARTLEWVAMPSSRGSSPLKDRTCISCVSCNAGGFFPAKPLGKPGEVYPGILHKVVLKQKSNKIMFSSKIIHIPYLSIYYKIIYNM